MTTAWYALSAEQFAQELQADIETGLTEAEAQRRLADDGPNELPEAPPLSPFILFLAQFSSVIVWVLIGAAVVSGLLQEWVDAGAILIIVFLNAVLGFVQEYRAEQSLAALRKLSIVTARVLRGGEIRSIPARELVRGDLIQVEAGDRMPADGRLVYAAGLQTQEASLTGESTPVAKSAESLSDDRLPIGDRRNMLFMGTVAVSGKGRALVAATGIGTELGKIATMINRAAQAEQEETPLQRRLEHLGHTLLWLSLGIVVLVFLLGLFRGVPLLTMFLTAVSLAVAAIPEGLPAIVTITLALGVTKMVKRHALIRRLPAVETLGSTTVICTDKTGTLTRNEMTVTRLYVNRQIVDVTGDGYTPKGLFLTDGTRVDQLSDGLRELLAASVLCNGASLKDEHGVWRVIGDPTEGALLVAAAKGQLFKEPLERAHPLLGEIPFDSARKMMTVVRVTAGEATAYVKGAPDVLLAHCTHMVTHEGRVEVLEDKTRARILDANHAFAHQALRVLGVARRALDNAPREYQAKVVEENLIFLGLAAMKDPLRLEAKAAVERCRQAGIRTVMITGDHKETAVAIARDLGILRDEAQALSGVELDGLDDRDLDRLVEQVTVYARVSAEHKLRIVRAWKSRGAVVAMTGDGVNDAPAIKAADIGVAMGLTGTDVAKEASDMVVTDDNFASIAAAVEEGRGVYDNIQKAVHYLLSCNISEVLVMLLTALIGMPLPLLPVQILWINLVTDGLPALALSVDPADPDIMKRSPRHPQAQILDRERLYVMCAQGLFMALITMATFAFCLYGMELDLDRARTLAFTVLVFVQLFHALNCRSDRYSLFQVGVWTNRPLVWAVAGSALLQVAVVLNPWTTGLFKTARFDPAHWLLALGVGVLPLLAMEVWKGMMRAATVRGREVR